MASPRVVMSFDFGLKHIGVAVGQTLTKTARGAGTVEVRKGKVPWSSIHTLITEYQPKELVVGLPLNMDGSDGDVMPAAQAFAEALGKRTGLSVAMHDERLTTKTAKANLDEARELGIAQSDHELAACLILEGWFDTR